jgi:regulator of replication initiation timing
MNLLTSLHSIFQHEEILRQEEEVEAMRLEEEDLDEDAGQNFEEEEEEEEGHEEGEEREEGHEDDAGLYDKGVGVTGLLQDPHPHAELGLATSFALL